MGIEDKARDYGWADVLKLRIVRPERDRRDFCELTLDLQDRSIRFRRDRETKEWRWSGAPAATVGRFLQQYVPAERTLLVILDEEPQSVEEVDYYLSKIREKRRGFRVGCRFMLLALAALWLLGGKGEVLAIVMFFGPVFVFFWFRDRRWAREEAEYVERRERLTAKALD